MLAPKAEVSMFPWKEPKERIPLAVPDPFLLPVASARSCLGIVATIDSYRLSELVQKTSSLNFVYVRRNSMADTLDEFAADCRVLKADPSPRGAKRCEKNCRTC